MLVNIFFFALGFICCLAISAPMYTKLRAEFNKAKEKVKDKLDGDDDKKDKEVNKVN